MTDEEGSERLEESGVTDLYAGALDGASLTDAQRIFRAAVAALPAVEVPLAEAAGYALARPVVAPFALPPFDNSAMDGYALRTTDTDGAAVATPVWLGLIGEASAGHPWPGNVQNGQAVRITTGAPLPGGANAVLPLEEARVEGGQLRVAEPVQPGRHVRQAGEDVHAGEEVLAAGRTLGPAALALLASLGLGSVPVHRRPRVGILTTGDELRLPGDADAEGCVYNANLFALAAQVTECGAEPVPLPVVRDTPDAVGQALDTLPPLDALLTSGGMGPGAHDHVAAALRARGELQTGELRLRPGRHVGLGRLGSAAVFMLPGNPGASLVAFELLVRPALRTHGGHSDWRRPTLSARLTEPVQGTVDATHVIRIALQEADGSWTARPAGPQGAAMLRTAARAAALLLVPEGTAMLPSGAVVPVHLLSGTLPQAVADERRMDQTPAMAGISHVQLAMPRGQETAARQFYGHVLGLPELPKPPELAARGGCWFGLASGQQLHLGVEEPFQPARKAHPCFLVADVRALRQHLEAAGIPTTSDTLRPDITRFYAADPFGNRLEFAEGEGTYRSVG